MTEAPEDVQKVVLRADKQRFSKLVTVDQLIQMQDGKLKTLRDVLSFFVLNDDGNYYPTDYDLKFQRHIPNPLAVARLGDLTIDEMNEAAGQFMRGVEGEAVPPPNAPA